MTRNPLKNIFRNRWKRTVRNRFNRGLRGKDLIAPVKKRIDYLIDKKERMK